MIIKQMSNKHPEMSWEVMDVRKITYEDSSFDIAIDKVNTWSLMTRLGKRISSVLIID